MVRGITQRHQFLAPKRFQDAIATLRNLKRTSAALAWRALLPGRGATLRQTVLHRIDESTLNAGHRHLVIGYGSGCISYSSQRWRPP